MNIKHIQTEKFKGLAILIPGDVNTWINPSIKKFIHIGDLQGDAYSIELPFDCEILGKATTLTEEQQERIIDDNIFIPQNSVLTTKDRFQELMNSLGFYIKNPYGTNPVKKEHYTPEEYYIAEELIRRWKEAEANTGTWVILEAIEK